nr:ead/Ea22-like family protein [Klebsiella pneumoniae]
MKTDITELAQSLKAAAEKASNGDWVKESGDGWEACCSANDQANGGFIIAHFVGPDAAENREFVQAANPANVLALVEALEYYKSREERVTSLVRDNSKSWDELYRQVEAKGKRNVELVEALEKAQQRIVELDRKNCELDSLTQRWAVERAENADHIAELESRTVKLPDDEDGQAYGFGKWANRKLPATAGTMTIAYCEDAWRAAFEVFSSAAGINVEAE